MTEDRQGQIDATIIALREENDALRKRIIVLENDKSFWLNAYRKLTTAAIESIDAAFLDTLVHEFENDSKCQRVLQALAYRVHACILGRGLTVAPQPPKVTP